jgi:anti-anti-sigma regulatory factor
MTIRLTASTDGTTTTVLVEGHLTGADLPDVSAACESADAALCLDLSHLKSADADGVRALRSLSEKGAELRGADPYVRELLREGDE